MRERAFIYQTRKPLQMTAMNPRQLHIYLAMVRARESGFTNYADALEQILRDEIAQAPTP